MNIYKAYVCVIQEDFLRISAETDQQAKDRAWALLKDKLFNDPDNFDVEIQVQVVPPAEPEDPCPKCNGHLLPRRSGGVRCTKCTYWFCY